VNRAVLPLAGFVLLAAVLAIGVYRAPGKGRIESPLIGRPAPGFSLPSLTDGSRNVSPDDWRGRWFLLNVWGTWCPGCRDEHQMLLDVEASNRIPIVGLNWKDDDAQALAWLAQLGNPYERIAVDHDGRAAIDWGVYGAPETFLVDPAGVVVYKHVGPLTRAVWEGEILPRLPTPAAAQASTSP
jgi:cytochrome c biogenesis protein CcmG/thiol:disulfide interchange protein DsbE